MKLIIRNNDEWTWKKQWAKMGWVFFSLVKFELNLISMFEVTFWLFKIDSSLKWKEKNIERMFSAIDKEKKVGEPSSVGQIHIYIVITNHCHKPLY